MILDELLFKKIKPIGEALLHRANLDTYPKNIEEMYTFLNQINISINCDEFEGLLIGNIFYSFVSALDVRDRHTTARTFEDIFSYLFGITATDTKHRQNPITPNEILELNKFNTEADDWRISSDLAGNKREKADTSIGNYTISLKTLRGVAYDENGKKLPKTVKIEGEEIIKNNQNNEINVGSLSYRALLKGIIPDEELDKLGDRKSGLGSGSAIRKNMLDKIIFYNKKDLFKERLILFMNYVYDEDLYIILKQNFRMTWYLIPSSSFITAIVTAYNLDEQNFQKIWYRWENNNLRMNWPSIIKKLDEYNLSYKKIIMDFGKAYSSKKILEFKDTISSTIENEILELMKIKVL